MAVTGAQPRDAPLLAKPDAVIEALGFGQAQVRYLVLAHGIWFVEILQVTLSVVLTVYVATQSSWSTSQRASLQALLFAGIACGSALGGWLGDRFGRRPPILACYALAALFQLLTVASGSLWVILPLRLCLGFAHGLGMPPSIALVSETSPMKYRVVLQGVRNIIFALGQILGSIIIIFDDPSYQHMSWRATMGAGVVPPLLLFACAAILMHESPVWLAKTGRLEAAEASLVAMRQLNGRDGASGVPAVDISLAPHGVNPQQQHLGQHGGDWSEPFRVMFCRHLVLSTVTLAMASFTMNCYLYGHMYAFPLVAAAEATSDSLAPGYQALLQGLISLLINFCVAPASALVSRQQLLALGSAVGAVGACAFAWAGGQGDQGGLVHVVYYVAQNTPGLCVSMGFCAVYQLAVDLYPVRIGATSGAVIIVAGRIGSIVISYVYEAFAYWQGFYIFLSALCMLTCSMAVTCLATSPPPEEELQKLNTHGKV